MTISQVFSYDQLNAPQLNGRVSSIVTLLDAALVNGGTNVTCSSVVVASEVATVITATAHGFAENDYVTISGSTGVTGLNAKWLVTGVTSSTEFTIAVPTIADGTATGSPVVKRSPLGWATAYTGTNLRAFRPASGARRYLRVDDTNADFALVQGYNAMSGISTGTGDFPDDPDNAGGWLWNKFKEAGNDGVSKSVTSIVALDGVATVVCTGHGLKSREWTTIAGATGLTALNGKVRVTVVDANTFTYVTEAADGTAGGTITSTKYVEVKWYLVGEATWFHLFVERANGVYDCYSFSDLVPVIGSTVNTVITGIEGDSLKAEAYGYPGAVVETIGAVAKPTHLFPVNNVESVRTLATTARSLPDSGPEVTFVYALDNDLQIQGRVPRLYAPLAAAAPSHDNWEIGVEPDGYNTERTRAFKVVMGQPAYVGNVFVGIDDTVYS